MARGVAARATAALLALVAVAASGALVPKLSIEVEDREAIKWDEPVPVTSLRFEGAEFYGATVRRRGSGRDTTSQPNQFGAVSSKDWPKRKFKLDFDGYVFTAFPGQPSVEEVNLHSMFEEPGVESYLREHVALWLLREAGVRAPNSRFVELHVNGDLEGLYLMVEQVDASFLERHGLPSNAPLLKAVHWRYSNMRSPWYNHSCPWAQPDFDVWHGCPEIWRVSNGGDGALAELASLAFKIESGDLSGLDLGRVADEMAAQTVLLHQDRCTKNAYMVRDWGGQWSRIPWDLENALGADYMTGEAVCGGCCDGTYAVLSCDAWNSLWYCDKEHPQDVGFDKADETYNHIVDAVLRDQYGRDLYLDAVRRLRDDFLAGGRLAQKVRSAWSEIAEVARDDAAKWGRPSPDRGVAQLLRIIATRAGQLAGV